MVGAKGFEPSTSWSRTRRASQAALRPDNAREGTSQAEAKNSTERNAAYSVFLGGTLRGMDMAASPNLRQ